MELSRTQRWILANQYRLLELLEKDQAEAHRQAQHILEHGYEAEYEQLCQHIDGEPLSEEEATYVLNVMEMFEYIQNIYDSLEDKTDVKEHLIDFPGFCGNSETQLMGYATHVVNGGRFSYLRKSGNSLNSHRSTNDQYRRMMEAYTASEDKYQLTKDDLIRIQEAAIRPSMRKNNEVTD